MNAAAEQDEIDAELDVIERRAIAQSERWLIWWEDGHGADVLHAANAYANLALAAGQRLSRTTEKGSDR